MENNIALTMREIADNVNEERERQKESRYLEAVNSKFIPYLKEEAEAGRYAVSFPTPGYDIFLIRKILREMGFTVEIFIYSKVRHLLVRW